LTLAVKAPDARRRLIVDATLVVLRERGFAGTRMADIAAKAGTSPALIAYHFRNLAGVLAEAMNVAEDLFYDEVAERLGDHADAVARLRAIAEVAARSGPALGDWVIWMEICVQALHDDNARTVREQLDRRWRAVLREIIDQGMVDGTFHCGDPDSTTLRLASLMDGLALQLALADPEMTSAKMADLWWHAAAIELGFATS
jgi:AcrR family transcriptional regulator